MEEEVVEEKKEEINNEIKEINNEIKTEEEKTIFSAMDGAYISMLKCRIETR